MNASHDQATTMTAALTIVPAIRPGLRVPGVLLRNICSWARQSSSPTSSPATTRPIGLSLEATQHGADVFLATSGQLEEDLLERLAVLSDHVPQLLQAAHGDETAAIDDGQPGAHAFRDLQDVGGEEDRLPFLTKVLEDVLHLTGTVWIQAHGRFVEEEHLWVMEQGGGQRHLLAHAARVAGKEVVAAFVQVEELQQRLDPAIAKAALDVVEVTRKLEEFPGAQLVVERRGIRHVPDPGLRSLRLGHDVDARHPGAATGGAQQAHQHLDGGRLAGAVGAQEAEQLPRSHLQIQVLHGRQAAVPLGQEPGGEHRAKSSGAARKTRLKWPSRVGLR